MFRKRFIIILLSVTIIGLVVFGIRLFLGDEDTWICTENGWVKHGNPASQTPPNVECNIQ